MKSAYKMSVAGLRYAAKGFYATYKSFQATDTIEPNKYYVNNSLQSNWNSIRVKKNPNMTTSRKNKMQCRRFV